MRLCWSRNRMRSPPDRKSTRLNSSHLGNSYAVFCLKKKDAAPWAVDAEAHAIRMRVIDQVAARCDEAGQFTVILACHFFLMIGSPPKFTLFPYLGPSR